MSFGLDLVRLGIEILGNVVQQVAVASVSRVLRQCSAVSGPLAKA
ncbi:MAG: hypothetical protein V4502_04150 [Pseudomonadota bacterium]